MEEIRIYHSFWKTLPSAILVWIAFATMIHETDDLSVYNFFGLLFTSLFLFGFGALSLLSLYFLLMVLKERILGQPFMTVTDNCLIVKGLLKKKVINFSEVKFFKLYLGSYGNSTLKVCYIPEIEHKKLDCISKLGRILCKSRRNRAERWDYSINTTLINTNMQELTILLNNLKKMPKLKQSSDESQRKKTRKLFMEFEHIGSAQKRSDKETTYATNYLPIFRVFLITLFLLAIYSLICWGRLEWEWFPQLSYDTIEELFVVPFLLHLYLCRNFFFAIKHNFNGILAAILVIGIFPLFLFLKTPTMLERMALDITEIPAITPDSEPILANAECIHVAKLTTADLDTTKGNYYFHIANDKSIFYCIHVAYPLSAIPNVYLVNSKKEAHSHLEKKEVLELRRQRFIDEEKNFILRMDLNDRYLKRLLPIDHIEGYQMAIKELYEKENKPFDPNKIILYKITSDKITKESHIYNVLFILAILFFEYILLIVCNRFLLNHKEYERMCKKSSGKICKILKSLKLHAF